MKVSGGLGACSEYSQHFNMDGLRIRWEGDGPGGVVGTHEGDTTASREAETRGF